MRNRPHGEFGLPAVKRGPALDTTPNLRLLLLFACGFVPVLLIVGRLGYLQAVIPERFVQEWDRRTEVFEAIPSRDGRILTSNGRVLACDEPQFDLTMHYRWLEEPPDEGWLTSQARQQLKPSQRRDSARLAAAKEEVLARRDAQIDALAEVAGISRSESEARARGVQSRVERIYGYVTRLRDQRFAAADTDDSAGPSWWERGWAALVSELTSPPQRTEREPLIIREQEEYHAVAQGVSLAAVGMVESLPSRFPGVRARQSSRRVYPEGTFAAHLIGARTPISGEELQARKERFPSGDPLAYSAGDRVGRNGIEQAYDARLRGRPGLRRCVRDRSGLVLHSEVVREAVHGADVVLALDAELQAAAEALLDEAIGWPPAIAETERREVIDQPVSDRPPQGGCLVAIDVRSGRVLAAAAAPRFDLGLLGDFDEAAWKLALSDPRRPFFPRITEMTVPPGSVFKTLTSVALLESGIDPDETIHCRGYLDRPDRDRCLIFRHYGIGHGEVDLETALCQSCNVYFFDAARRIGPRAIHDWAQRFGLGRATGIDLPGERNGHLPDPDATTRAEPWYPGTTLQLAIGQSSLTVTPLHVARMMAAIANDGYLVTPRIVEESVEPRPAGSDHPILLAGFELPGEANGERQRIGGLSPRTLRRVRAGLRRVVEDSHGTGKRVRMDRIAIAGKTGTAEVGGGRPDHAWFAGYAPAEEPRVAFVVVLEEGGSGGQVAGPIARRFVEAMLSTGALRESVPRLAE